MKVFSLPFTGFLIAWILPFGLFEGRWMIVPTAVYTCGGYDLVEHFVENNAFNKIVWDKGLIEKSVNANEVLLTVVNAKANGRPFSL